jgi:DNA polymerase V
MKRLPEVRSLVAPHNRRMFDKTTSNPVSLWPQAAHAGFASPGEEYTEPPLNLNDLVVKNSLATYFVRIYGDSMRGAHIDDGDVVVVDKSLPIQHNALIVVRVGSHLLLKRLLFQDSQIILQTDPPDGLPLLFDAAGDMEIWGTVTYSIHDCQK